MIYLSIGKCNSSRDSQSESAKDLLSSLLCNLGFPEAEIFKDERGRPYTATGIPDISVSHSKNACVACAVFDDIAEGSFTLVIPADGKCVGVDIEHIPKNASIERCQSIANRFLNTEVTSIDDFYRLWTRKESYGKMTGDGFFAKDGIPCTIFSFLLEIDGERYSLSISIK